MKDYQKLFRCSVGKDSCYITHDGFYRFCLCLSAAGCQYDLKKFKLKTVHEKLTERILNSKPEHPDLLDKCRKCSSASLCDWCPALSYLETKCMDKIIEPICEIAGRKYEFFDEFKK